MYLVPLDTEAVAEVAATSRELRRDISVQYGLTRRNPGRGMKDADRSGARFAALRGERERAAGQFEVKDLQSGSQESVAEDQLLSWLHERMEQ